MVIELINGLCVEITPHRGEAHWWGWRNPGTRQRPQGSRALDAQTQGERTGRDALAPAYVWRGSDTDESSHPKALDL